MMIRRTLIAVIVVFATIAPTLTFADAVPTPEQFLGYRLGDRFTAWDQILRYFDELQRKSDRITVQQFGETYEHRPLVYAVITSPKNRAALDSIKGNLAELSRGDQTSETRAKEIASSTPAVVWLAFGVHGDESSSAEAAMLTASYLLSGSSEAESLLDRCVVIIDPLQNPDGRERYVQWFRRTLGMEPNPNPDAFEHTQPWPGGRYNHYLIDMNRDWAWTSQQETRARVALYHQWNPQVFVDFHEMGYQSSYFFPPDASPINANLPKDEEKWLEVFGRANAAGFSKKGWPFFVAERFDLFYPGYGDSWPALHGAVGMTYEVAGHGRAGVAITREDGTTYTLADRIQRHYTTAVATVQTTAAHANELLLFTWQSMRAQLERGKNTYLIVPGSPNFEPMLDLLRRQQVQIGRLTSSVSLRANRIDNDAAETRAFPPGTAVVSTHQPAGGLVQTLMERTPVFSKGFLEEQREKVQADEGDDFYDLTAWSLPLAQNVETWVTTAPLSPTAADQPLTSPPFRSASFGYVIDGLDPSIYRAAGRMLANGIRFSVSDGELPMDGRTFSRGSLLVLKTNNKPDLDTQLEQLARDTHVALAALESGWSGGASVGSEKIHFVKDPKIGLVGGPGTTSTSYGMLWYTLDVDTHVPHSTLSIEALRNLDLGHYSVLIFPDGSDYADRLGKRGVEKLQTWVRSGGTLIGIKDASAFFRSKDVELSKLKPWAPPKKKDSDDTPTTDERYNQYRIPGSAFRTSINERSYLTFGVTRPPSVLMEGTTILLPVSHKVDNIVTIDAKDPLSAGFAWPESIERIKGSVYLVTEPFGRGQVITFADEPNYRLFWRGTLPLFMNAVLYSPSFRGGND
jgi:hypothetical protein